MKKPSIYKRLYKSSIILFTTFILFILGINTFLSYQNFLDAKKKIQQDILQTKKKILKSEVDFIASQIEPAIKKEQQRVHNNIKDKVLTAYSIALNLYQKNKNNPNIENIIKESLRKLKFQELGDQYVFMTKLSGEFLLNPGFPELEGKNVYDLSNDINRTSFEKVIQMVREKKEGYLRYDWQNHRNLMFEQKVSYFKYFQPFDCYIGIGVFNSDIDNNLKMKFIEKVESYRLGEKADDYIFAGTYTGKSLTYPAKGKNMYHITDLKGKKVVQELIKAAQKGGGYVEYIVPVGKNKEQEKISYVVGIDRWHLYIGSGKTLSGIGEEIEQKKEELLNSLYNNITFISILGTIFLIIYYIIFHKLKSPLESDIKNLIDSIVTLVNDNQKIKTKDIKFREFEEISLQTNKLLDQKKIISNELKNKEALLYHQSKMAAMGEMLENIAHQWRQPLSVITTSSSAIQLKQELQLLEEDFLQESVESILENAEYLSHTIDDFRSFFQKDKEKEEFKLEETVTKTLKLLHSKFRHQNIIVKKEFKPIILNTYKNELIQVILVILQNAKDALENIKDKQRFIFIKTYQDKDFTYIEIKDNAEGIEDSIMEKIFDPYFTTKHQSQGTGIGLYMAREIISKHMNGDIEIQNDHYEYDHTEQTGALFIIKLPI